MNFKASKVLLAISVACSTPAIAHEPVVPAHQVVAASSHTVLTNHTATVNLATACVSNTSVCVPPPQHVCLTTAQAECNHGIHEIRQGLVIYHQACADLSSAHTLQTKAACETHEAAVLTNIGNRDIQRGEALLKEGGCYTKLGHLLLCEGQHDLTLAQTLATRASSLTQQCADLKTAAAQAFQNSCSLEEQGFQDIRTAAASQTGSVPTGSATAGVNMALLNRGLSLENRSLSTIAAGRADIAESQQHTAEANSLHTAAKEQYAAGNVQGAFMDNFTAGVVLTDAREDYRTGTAAINRGDALMAAGAALISRSMVHATPVVPANGDGNCGGGGSGTGTGTGTGSGTGTGTGSGGGSCYPGGGLTGGGSGSGTGTGGGTDTGNGGGTGYGGGSSCGYGSGHDDRGGGDDRNGNRSEWTAQWQQQPGSGWADCFGQD